MFFYFNSKTPAILKINGVYHGKIDDSYKKFFIDVSTSPFIEICFVCAKTSPLFFMLDSNFLCSPPDNVVITDLKGGYAINVCEEQVLAPFTIINQQKFPFAVATVFNDNGLKLSIETANDFYAENLNFSCKNAEILLFNLDNRQFLAINFISEQNLLSCFLIEDKITKVFSKTAVEFSFDNGFTTIEEYFDIAKHKLTCSWKLSGNAFAPLDTKIETSNDYLVENLCDNILPYAFLEEFMLNSDANQFLSDGVKQNAQFLNEYLGNYIGVFPPPSFRKFDEIALLYKNGQNKYKTEYFKFELENRKIYNIKRSDNWPFLFIYSLLK